MSTLVDQLLKTTEIKDFGKIAVDDAILRKPGKYTQEEYEIIFVFQKRFA